MPFLGETGTWEEAKQPPCTQGPGLWLWWVRGELAACPGLNMGQRSGYQGVAQQSSWTKATRNFVLAEELSPSFPEHTGHQIRHTPHGPTLAALGLGGGPGRQAVVPTREVGRAHRPHPW